MKKTVLIILLVVFLFVFVSCNKAEKLNAIQSFTVVDTLPQADETPIRVVLLFGQSNATGVASNAYLAQNSPEEYQKALNGYDNVLINYVTENGANSSAGMFVRASLGQAVNKDYFGPEVGMANILAKKYSDTTIILKYAWGGSKLDTQWMDANYRRGELYDAALSFVTASLEYLVKKGYKPYVSAVCWMQGESDAFFEEMANRYYKNTDKFVRCLRKDLAKYTNKDFTFIDAGIAEIDILWIEHKIINEAKKQYALDHENCEYFSTQELGLVTNQEPAEGPDLAHYDSMSEFKLGQEFAKYI